MKSFPFHDPNTAVFMSMQSSVEDRSILRISCLALVTETSENCCDQMQSPQLKSAYIDRFTFNDTNPMSDREKPIKVIRPLLSSSTSPLDACSRVDI